MRLPTDRAFHPVTFATRDGAFFTPAHSDFKTGDSRAAEDEYCQKIYDGALPWVVIGVEVARKTAANWDRPHVVGASYLGGCDFLPFDGSDYGNETGRAMIREAIADARLTLGDA